MRWCSAWGRRSRGRCGGAGGSLIRSAGLVERGRCGRSGAGRCGRGGRRLGGGGRGIRGSGGPARAAGGTRTRGGARRRGRVATRTHGRAWGGGARRIWWIGCVTRGSCGGQGWGRWDTVCGIVCGRVHVWRGVWKIRFVKNDMARDDNTARFQIKAPITLVLEGIS